MTVLLSHRIGSVYRTVSEGVEWSSVNGLFELAALRSRTRKANNVMKIRNPGPNWALHMVNEAGGASQKFI